MNEETVKNTKILPFLEKLGFDRKKDLEYEKTLDDGSRLDILLKHEKQNICVLECKKADINIGQEKIIRQVYDYAANFQINSPFFALSNGRQFHLFKITNNQSPIYQNDLESIDDSEIEKIKNILFNGKTVKVSKREGDDWYLAKKLPEVILKPKKQGTRRHFGVHGYFTKQSWDIVDRHIRHFTQTRDVVLDPFGGSGVTFIEALMNGRYATHIDLNPLSIFWMETILSPIELDKLNQQGLKIIEQFKKGIKKVTLKELKNVLPENVPILSKGADAKKLHQIFSKKQLKELGYLKQLILKVRDKTIRNNLLLAFSSNLTKNNLTYHTSKLAESNPYGGNSGIFMYYRYRIAKKSVKINIEKSFQKKVDYLIKAKKELQAIPKEVSQKALIYKGDATDLTIRLNSVVKPQSIKNESVDYIYTDPPYGKKIEYLDLSVMWNAWLGLKVTGDDYKREAIEGGHLNKDKDTYKTMIIQSLQEMFRVLKWNRWMSFVFQHQDKDYWYLIVENAEKIGFEYQGVTKQNNGQTSFKKRQNPFTVLSGQLIIHFLKKKNPQSILKANLGGDINDFILNNIEAVIAEKDGATINEINDSLVINALEIGFLDKLSEHGDITPYLQEHFAYDQTNEKYHLRPQATFKSHIPLDKRIEYFLLSYLRRKNREDRYPSFDDIVYDILPLLKNGKIPEKQSIKKVLDKIAIADETRGGYLLKDSDEKQMRMF